MARILYLDDEGPMVLLTTRLLEVLGHQVSGYTDAAHALAAFEKDPASFDLVITDLAMPGTTGLEFAQQIQAIRPSAAVAAASGSVNPHDIENARARGIVDVVMKPHTIEGMSRTIDDLLGKAALFKPAGR